MSYSTIVTTTKLNGQPLKSKQTLSDCEFGRLESTHYIERRTYSGLKRAWIGFKIAKKEGDHDKMKYYADGIQKFERQLRLPVSKFPDILERPRQRKTKGREQYSNQ